MRDPLFRHVGIPKDSVLADMKCLSNELMARPRDIHVYLTCGGLNNTENELFVGNKSKHNEHKENYDENQNEVR